VNDFRVFLRFSWLAEERQQPSLGLSAAVDTKVAESNDAFDAATRQKPSHCPRNATALDLG
jgi:hypothetical protein